MYMHIRKAITDLTGKLLIAMPDMGDPRFEKSVILICSHSSDGAMGLILNRAVQDIRFSDLISQLNVPVNGTVHDIPLHFGGPVEMGRGFVLHSDDYPVSNRSMRIPGGFRVTSTVDILEAIAKGRGPEKALMTLGYSGWGPGQLEAELQQNGWLTAEATHEVVFADDIIGKWNASLDSMGVNALHLSATGGTA